MSSVDDITCESTFDPPTSSPFPGKEVSEQANTRGVELRIRADDHRNNGQWTPIQHPLSSDEDLPTESSGRILLPHDCPHHLQFRLWTYPSVIPVRENESVLVMVRPDGSEFVLPRSSDLQIPEDLAVFHQIVEGVFRNNHVSNLILEDMHFYPEALHDLLQYPLPSCVIWHEIWQPKETYQISTETLAFFEAWQPKHLCFQIEGSDVLPVPMDQLTTMSYVSELRTLYIGSDNEAGRWHNFDGSEYINDDFLQRAVNLRRLEVYTRTGITVDGLKSILTSWWIGERVFESIVFELSTGFQNVFNILQSILDEHTTYTSEDCHELPGIQAGMSYKFSIVPTKASIKCIDAYMFGTDEYTRIRFIDREVEPEADTWFKCTEPSEWCLLCWYREPDANMEYPELIAE